MLIFSDLPVILIIKGDLKKNCDLLNTFLNRNVTHCTIGTKR
jgi:hypothetical protein